MNTADILFSGDRLTIRKSILREQCILLWSGECDFRNPAETLGPVLESVADTISERRIIVDFRDLSFMNSSAVTPILVFLKGIVARGCQVHLIYNSQISWQRSTASAMRTLSHSLKGITVALEGAGDGVY
jgi:anti-anti-sigma factor